MILLSVQIKSVSGLLRSFYPAPESVSSPYPAPEPMSSPYPAPESVSSPYPAPESELLPDPPVLADSEEPLFKNLSGKIVPISILNAFSGTELLSLSAQDIRENQVRCVYDLVEKLFDALGPLSKVQQDVQLVCGNLTLSKSVNSSRALFGEFFDLDETEVNRGDLDDTESKHRDFHAHGVANLHVHRVKTSDTTNLNDHGAEDTPIILQAILTTLPPPSAVPEPRFNLVNPRFGFKPAVDDAVDDAVISKECAESWNRNMFGGPLNHGIP